MHLKKRLQANETVYGVFCSTPAALSIEIIAAAGYDFVVIDLEHTLIDARQLAAMLLAARASGLAALVRVAASYQALSPVWSLRHGRLRAATRGRSTPPAPQRHAITGHTRSRCVTLTRTSWSWTNDSRRSRSATHPFAGFTPACCGPRDRRGMVWGSTLSGRTFPTISSFVGSRTMAT